MESVPSVLLGCFSEQGYYGLMKLPRPPTTIRAFTVIELLVVIAIIAVLIAVTFPAMDGRRTKATLAACINNQRQILNSELCWAAEHDDCFPWQASITNGGTMELASNGSVFPHFQVLSNCLTRPELLVCSTDKAKKAHTNLSELTDRNVSYFVNLNTKPSGAPVILTGDRHLQINRQPVRAGLLVLSTNTAVGWTRELHSQSANVPIGVIAFTDGHAEAIKEKLPAYFQYQNLPLSRLAIP